MEERCYKKEKQKWRKMLNKFAYEAKEWLVKVKKYESGCVKWLDQTKDDKRNNMCILEILLVMINLTIE